MSMTWRGVSIRGLLKAMESGMGARYSMNYRGSQNSREEQSQAVECG